MKKCHIPRRIHAGWSEEFRETINVASTLGLGTSRQTMLQGGTVRNSFAGVSGQMAVMAWDMVKAGFNGEHDGLATIWGSVLSESRDPAALTEELGTRWEIPRNYFKRHSCCRYNHGALDVLARICADSRSRSVRLIRSASRPIPWRRS